MLKRWGASITSCNFSACCYCIVCFATKAELHLSFINLVKLYVDQNLLNIINICWTESSKGGETDKALMEVKEKCWLQYWPSLGISAVVCVTRLVNLRPRICLFLFDSIYCVYINNVYIWYKVVSFPLLVCCVLLFRVVLLVRAKKKKRRKNW